MSNKKIIIWVVLVVVVLLIIVFGFLNFKRNNVSDPNNQGVKVNDIKSTVTSEVGKTNPFKADVNPYNGYKNPFAQ